MQELLKLISDYSYALHLLVQYDYQNLKIPEGKAKFPDTLEGTLPNSKSLLWNFSNILVNFEMENNLAYFIYEKSTIRI